MSNTPYTLEDFDFKETRATYQTRTLRLFELYRNYDNVTDKTEAEALRLIEAGVDPRAVHIGSDQTILHLFCAHGHIKAAEAIQKAGAAIDALDSDGRTPLCDAVLFEQHDCMEFLLKHGANPDAADGGEPLLHKTYDLKSIVLLIQAGANLDAKNIDDVTPLQLAVKSTALYKARCLLEAGADVHVRMPGDGASLILFAANIKNVDFFNLLLEFGANIDDRDYMNLNVTFRAALANNDKVLAVALKAGAKVNLVGTDNKPPLCYGKYSVTEWLLQYGANIHANGFNLDHPDYLMLRGHLRHMQERVAKMEPPRDIEDLNWMLVVMPVTNNIAIPEPRELAEQFFRTLPHTPKLNALYEEYLGHPRQPEITENLQTMRQHARSSGVGL